MVCVLEIKKGDNCALLQIDFQKIIFGKFSKILTLKILASQKAIADTSVWQVGVALEGAFNHSLLKLVVQKQNCEDDNFWTFEGRLIDSAGRRKRKRIRRVPSFPCYRFPISKSNFVFDDDTKILKLQIFASQKQKIYYHLENHKQCIDFMKNST